MEYIRVHMKHNSLTRGGGTKSWLVQLITDASVTCTCRNKLINPWYTLPVWSTTSSTDVRRTSSISNIVSRNTRASTQKERNKMDKQLTSKNIVRDLLSDMTVNKSNFNISLPNHGKDRASPGWTGSPQTHQGWSQEWEAYPTSHQVQGLAVGFVVFDCNHWGQLLIEDSIAVGPIPPEAERLGEWNFRVL